MKRIWLIASAALLFAMTSAQAGEKAYSIKEATTPAPKEIKEAIRNQLKGSSIQLLDARGELLCEVWFRKEIPAEATPEQVKNGLTYQELQETTLLGVIQFPKPTKDYRKQDIKAGVYTLRLAFQPMDGDHMGTAMYRDFCLLVPISEEKDEKPLGSQKELQELSTKATGKGHPAVFLLFPNSKPAATPELASKDNGHWVLNVKEEVKAGTQKAAIGIGLTLVGHTSAE